MRNLLRLVPLALHGRWLNQCLFSYCTSVGFVSRRIFGTLGADNQFKVSNQVKIQEFFDKLSNNDELIPEDIANYQKETIKSLLKSRKDLILFMKELEELQNDKDCDKELKLGAEEECETYRSQLNVVEKNLFECLLPEDEASEFNEAVLEVSAGVGGQEAMLFARDLFEMYIGYIEYKGWDYTLAETDSTELGGLRFASALVEGDDVFKWLQFETGVHRVQRIPLTEKSGKVHTSTATVAVLPQPKEIQIKINDKDLIVDTMRASGAGGQHVNKTDSAVRLTHLPSGIAIVCQAGRSQIKNRQIALKRLQAKLFQIQLDNQTSRLKNLRKDQVGSSLRSDKIRTYNFNQDRITDHRITNNFHNINGFLEGNKYLDQLIDNLIENKNKQRINLFLESLGIKTV